MYNQYRLGNILFCGIIVTSWILHMSIIFFMYEIPFWVFSSDAEETTCRYDHYSINQTACHYEKYTTDLKVCYDIDIVLKYNIHNLTKDITIAKTFSLIRNTYIEGNITEFLEKKYPTNTILQCYYSKSNPAYVKILYDFYLLIISTTIIYVLVFDMTMLYDNYKILFMNR